jgi:hypothetical protein
MKVFYRPMPLEIIFVEAVLESICKIGIKMSEAFTIQMLTTKYEGQSV